MFYAHTLSNDKIFVERSLDVTEAIDLTIDAQGGGDRYTMIRSEALDLVRALHEVLDLPPLGARVR